MCEIYDDNVSEKENTNVKKLIKKIDILGRQLVNSSGNLIFYIYNDGTVSKKIQL